MITKESIQQETEQMIQEIERILWEIDIAVDEHKYMPTEYSDDTLRAAVKVFSHVMMNKLWFHFKDKHKQKERESAAELLGTDIKELIKRWVGKDTTNIS